MLSLKSIFNSSIKQLQFSTEGYEFWGSWYVMIGTFDRQEFSVSLLVNLEYSISSLQLHGDHSPLCFPFLYSRHVSVGTRAI